MIAGSYRAVGGLGQAGRADCAQSAVVSVRKTNCSMFEEMKGD